jgi:hypothetical protein
VRYSTCPTPGPRGVEPQLSLGVKGTGLFITDRSVGSGDDK